MISIRYKIGKSRKRLAGIVLAFFLTALQGCGGYQGVYHDPNMDFGSIRTVAVMPFTNLTNSKTAGERVRDVFITSLLATGAIYAIPTGEVGRGMERARLANPSAPSTEEITRLSSIIEADALIVGVVREYGQERAGSTEANTISFSVQMIETQTGRVVWSASSTKGGVTMKDRLFGAGGRPMNEVTMEAVNEVLDKLFF